MPYIREFRKRLLEGLDRPDTPGELNYQLTMLIKEYIELKGLRYQTINDILGALDGARAEFYRRVVAPYEDQKIEENGDVW